MSMIYILLSSVLYAQDDSTQNLVYDLSINGVTVGQRKVDITYIPSSKSNPLGMRRIELWTTAKLTIQGQEFAYTQRGMAQLSEQKVNFVISTQLNDQITEVQGKRSKEGNWLVHQISAKNLKKTEYRRAQVSAISLELFDPARSELWQSQESYQILVIEALEPFIMQGSWEKAETKVVNTEIRSLAAKKLKGKSKDGILNAVWSDDGMLIDWDIAIMGIELHADIRSAPQSPNFGDIISPQKLADIEEKEL